MPLDRADRFFKEASRDDLVEDVTEVEDDDKSREAVDEVVFFMGG